MKFLKRNAFDALVLLAGALLYAAAFAGATMAIATGLVHPFLPDPNITPGVVRDISLDEVCNTKWGKDARAVTEAMKNQVYKAYGTERGVGACALSPRGCEVDHLISRELGGADDVKNLWIQPYGGPWNAIMKDRYENFLHKLVCAGKMTLKDAQSEISTDWIKGYKSHPELPLPSGLN